MKKVLAFALMAGLVISLTGCGTEAAKSGGNNSDIVQPDTAKVGGASLGQGSAIGAERAIQVTKIKLTFDGGEAIAELYDNPTSRDLVSMLPLALSFKDFNGTEKIAYPPRSLSTAKAPDGFDPSEGDLTLYAPWGNLALFYRDFHYSKGLVPIGYLTTGLEKLAKMNGDFTIRIEAANQ